MEIKGALIHVIQMFRQVLFSWKEGNHRLARSTATFYCVCPVCSSCVPFHPQKNSMRKRFLLSIPISQVRSEARTQARPSSHVHDCCSIVSAEQTGCVAGGIAKWCSHSGMQPGGSSKCSTALSYHPATPLPGIHPHTENVMSTQKQVH